MLPIVFADKLPKRPGNGYERLGFVCDGAAHGRPIGTSFQVGPRRPGRAQLRDLPRRHHPQQRRPSRARVVARHARQPDGPAGLRALPDRVRQRQPRSPPSTLIAAIEKENPDFGLFERLLYRLVDRVAHARRHPRPGQGECLVRRAGRRKGPGRVDTFNPYKVLLQHRHRQRSDSRHGRPAVAVEPAHPARLVAALGRQQRLGRGAQQERRDRRRRHARFARPESDGAGRRVDPRSQAAGVSGRADRRGEGGAGRRHLPARVRQLPRGRATAGPGRSRRSRRSAPIASASTRSPPRWPPA